MIRRLKQWMQGAAGPQAAGEGAELRVLMVCMGNICRSPTAEGVLRDRLQRAGLQQRVAVDSAGTLDHHAGEPPDPRAQRHAALRGYDLSTQRARAVRAEDFSHFHWVLAMDEDNLAWLQRRAPPGSTARIGLLMPHARRFAGVQAVPDPYYGSAAGFERVLDLVEDACDGLVARLQQELDAGPGAKPY
jgi:protein-tyrosine phosphatase